MSGSKHHKGMRKAQGKLSAEKLIKSYEHDCAIRNLAKETILKRSYILRSFSNYAEGQRIHILDVDKELLRSYVEYLKFDRNLATKSVQIHLTALSSFYDYLEFVDVIEENPVPSVRKRYQRGYKDSEGHTHRIITTEEMGLLIRSAVDIRDRCMMAVLAKTGIRRGELISLDADDINLTETSITLKHTAKRSNKIVYFDGETEGLIRRWLKARESRNKKGSSALFISRRGGRLERFGVDWTVIQHAQKLELHNPNSDKLEDHFTPHCFRHWFTTVLIRAGMPRDYVKELRGDARREAIDIYNHIDKKELRESYLAHIPQLGI